MPPVALVSNCKSSCRAGHIIAYHGVDRQQQLHTQPPSPPFYIDVDPATRTAKRSGCGRARIKRSITGLPLPLQSVDGKQGYGNDSGRQRRDGINPQAAMVGQFLRYNAGKTSPTTRANTAKSHGYNSNSSPIIGIRRNQMFTM